jgi:hypothetical protein
MSIGNHSAFIFRVKQSTLLGLLDPEDEGNMIVQNIGNCLAVNVA